MKLELINLFILIRMAKLFEPGFGYGRRIVAHNLCIQTVRYLILWLKKKLTNMMHSNAMCVSIVCQ